MSREILYARIDKELILWYRIQALKEGVKFNEYLEQILLKSKEKIEKGEF